MLDAIADTVEPLVVFDLNTSKNGITFTVSTDTIGEILILEYPFTIDDFWQAVDDTEHSAREAADEYEGWLAIPLELSGEQRLHVVIGSPGLVTLGNYLAGHEGTRWVARAPIAAGDLLLTILDTTPPMILCLERTARKFTSPRQSLAIAERVDFADALIPKAAVDQYLDGAAIAMRPHAVGERREQQILDALARERREPTPTDSLFDGLGGCTPWSGVRAQAIAASDRTCRCCEVNYGIALNGAAVTALEVHDHVIRTRTGRANPDIGWKLPVVLCASCHRLVHESGTDDIDAIRNALDERSL